MGVPRFVTRYLFAFFCDIGLIVSGLIGIGIAYHIENWVVGLMMLPLLFNVFSAWENWKKAVTPWWAENYEHYRSVMRGRDE